MARYSSDHKKETHDRIVSSAAKYFRSKGYDGAGVDGIMGSVGLTSGGFYAHFKSKSSLFQEAVSKCLKAVRFDAFLNGIEGLAPGAWYETVVKRALSRWHRDHAADGCALTALVSDIARAPTDLKEFYEEELLKSIEIVRERLPGKDSEARIKALQTLIIFIGGVNLARAVASPELSDEILAAAKEALLN